MRVRELLLLAEGLLEMQKDIDNYVVEDIIFDMRDWKVSIKNLDINKKRFDCGFAGCAIGWAPKFIPDFPLTATKEGWGITFRMIADYFGITHETACYLFGSSTYINPRKPELVAKRIYDVVRRHVNE